MIFKISCFQQQKKYDETYKETRQYGPNTGGKKQSIKTIPKKAQMLDLLDKDFKLAILNMFKQLKQTISRVLKESMRTISHQIGNIHKEKEFLNKT